MSQMTNEMTNQMSNQLTNDRKLEHIRAIEQDGGIDRDGRHFDRIQLTHRALPELDLASIDPSTTFLDKRLSFPLLISSMTGGDHALVCGINRNLALAAESCQVAMAVGSQRVMFARPQARKSFMLREYAPTALLMANLGAVQFNYGFDQRQCQQAVEVLEADALYLHLNPLQEAVQPEGDVNFRGLVDKIGAVRNDVRVPLILKEVGCGLSPMDVELGLRAGVSFFDVAGTGGTSWSRIEHHRRALPGDDLGLKFQDWGLPTPLALQQLEPYRARVTLIASGGLRSGIDMAKSVILGASLCGLAAPFLQAAMESAEAVVARIEQLRREYITTLFLLGMPDTAALFGNKALMVAAP